MGSKLGAFVKIENQIFNGGSFGSDITAIAWHQGKKDIMVVKEDGAQFWFPVVR
jgi:hypothetical protein